MEETVYSYFHDSYFDDYRGRCYDMDKESSNHTAILAIRVENRTPKSVWVNNGVEKRGGWFELCK